MEILQSALGLVVFLALAFGLGEARRQIRWNAVGIGVAVQIALGAALLNLPGVAGALAVASQGVSLLEEAAQAGASFMFGYLAGGPPPFEVVDPGSTFIVGFRVLPLILVVSALSAVLFHWGVLPLVIRGMAWVIQRVFKTSGALGFAAASSVFFGIIESPLLIKPYLARLSRSELFALMTCGMSTVAGTVMVLYASIIEPVIPGALGHILVASVMSVPAALVIAHLMIPGEASAEAPASLDVPQEDASAMGALMRGTWEGMRMVVGIAATLIVLFALIHLLNRGLGAALPLWDDQPVTAQRLAGVVFQPLLWLAGLSWQEASVAAPLFGTKTLLNEFVAYLELSKLPPEALSERGRLIVMYSMCGFANLGSLGILVGGLGSILPDRQREIIHLGARAVLAGTLATLMTGAVIGLLTG